MGFLEITKLHLARQGSARPNSRVLDGHAVKWVIWETENMVIFQDHEGRYWRHHKIYGQSWEAVVTNARKTIAPAMQDPADTIAKHIIGRLNEPGFPRYNSAMKWVF
jgi:hypothetical protein